MRANICTRLVAVLAIGFLFTGCDSGTTDVDDTDDTGLDALNGSFEADVEGRLTESISNDDPFHLMFTVIRGENTDRLTVFITLSSEDPERIINITGWDILELDESPAEGTFEIVDKVAGGTIVPGEYTAQYTAGDESLIFPSTGGQLTISSVTSKVIEGEFEFTGRDITTEETVSVSGSFRSICNFTVLSDGVEGCF